MKVDVFDTTGKAVGKIDLPKVFSEPVRRDLVLRAVLSTQSKSRQVYAVDPMAGKRTSAHYHGVRRERYSMMGKEMARMPRLHGKLSPHLMWKAKFAPQVTGGREAMPPISEKIWDQKINAKERKKAIRSAIAATAREDFVKKRGHRFDIKELPIVIDDKIQEMSKTKDLVELMKKLGLEKELARIEERSIRAGRGKSRGRKYKKRIGPLIVVTEDKGISKAANNIPGVNVCKVGNLSAAYLAPGTEPGRLTIFSKSSIEKLGG
jgi:large subunit ribosomal protein L4e